MTSKTPYTEEKTQTTLYIIYVNTSELIQLLLINSMLGVKRPHNIQMTEKEWSGVVGSGGEKELWIFRNRRNRIRLIELNQRALSLSPHAEREETTKCYCRDAIVSAEASG